MSGEKFLSSVRDGQLELAGAIAVELVALAKECDALRCAASPADLDPEAVQLMLESEARMRVLRAVHGYTDWLACTVVRSRGFARRRRLEMPDDGALAVIAAKYDVPPAILRFVIARMHVADRLPLLGRPRQGRLIPDVRALRMWATFFDWSQAPVPTATAGDA